MFFSLCTGQIKLNWIFFLEETKEEGCVYLDFLDGNREMKNDFLIYFWCRVSTKKSYIAYAKAPVSFNTRPVGFPRFSWKILGHYNLKFNTSDLQAISQNFPIGIYRLSLNYNVGSSYLRTFFLAYTLPHRWKFVSPSHFCIKRQFILLPIKLFKSDVCTRWSKKDYRISAP